MKKPPLKILMAAAECRGLAKVGGLADVVFDLSKSLVEAGHSVLVVVPAYETIAVESQLVLDFLVRFGGQSVPTRLRKTSVGGLEVFLIDGPYFRGEWGTVYVDSGARGRGPFEDDAQRFAYFSAAVWTLVRTQLPFSGIEILHCHDWHTAWIPLLQQVEQSSLGVRTVFTIHNLDYQGTRPLDEPYAPGASFRQWFPEHWDAFASSSVFNLSRDPTAPHCFNPMRAGIRLSHAVNTVSPTYAREITEPDSPAQNFFGGRGLDPDLQVRRREGRLEGILNGMDYVSQDPARLDPPYGADSKDLATLKSVHKQAFLKGLAARVSELAQKLGSRFPNSPRVLAHVDAFSQQALDRPLVVCVTRAVRQKLSLMIDPLTPTRIVLDGFLDNPLSLIVIGSGELEGQLEPLNDHPSALFINAFDPALAQTMYSVGELFLMPSDFEPCGLSQLQALRFGCLPIVHDRGGLHDTVEHLKTGFVYSGTTRELTVQNFLEVTELALGTLAQPKNRDAMIREAMRRRFTWEAGTRDYESLYQRILIST